MTEAKWAFEIPGKLEIPYRYFAGAFCSQWFKALRDKQQILGCRCPSCKKVFVPPRGNCERCLVKIEEWVPLSGRGTVESFTVVRYAEPYQPQKPPLVLAAIKLDGADTALVHLLEGVAPDQLKEGLRVEPVFAEERKGRITDLAGFRPLSGKPKVPPQKKAAAPKKPKAKTRKAASRKPAAKKAVRKTAGRKAVRKRAVKALAQKRKTKKPARKKTAGKRSR